MTNTIKSVDLRFHHPARIIVCGPSNSGKTTLVQQLLTQQFFRDPITKVVWYYGHNQQGYQTRRRTIAFKEGLPDDLNRDFPGVTPPGKTRILILDDLMKEATNNEGVLDIFTKESHHKNITAILLTQNLYFRGKHTVDISRNASVIIFMIGPRNMQVIKRFLHSCYERHQVRQIMDWLRKETYEKPFSSFMVDLDVRTPEQLRLRLNVIPSAERGFTQIFFFPPPPQPPSSRCG